jgi:hypothetical protein
MRISKDVRGLQYLDEAACVSHVRRVTRTDLIQMGYDRDLVATHSEEKKKEEEEKEENVCGCKGAHLWQLQK